MPAPDQQNISAADQKLVQETLGKLFGGQPPVNAPIAARMRRPRIADPKPVTEPYVLGEGEEAEGDYWGVIRRFGGENPRIEFSRNDTVEDDNSVPALPGIIVGPGGAVVVRIGDNPADFANTSWKILSLQLGEVLKTARANYGADWGK